MERGDALTDADRGPWLARVRAEAVRVCMLQERENEWAVRGEEEKEKKGEGEEGEGKEGEEAVLKRRGIVVGCSALKRAYRDVLRGEVRPSTDAPPPATNDGEVRGKENESIGVLSQDTPTYLRTYFVYIRGSRSVLLERMEHRKGHFMKAGMLDGQLQTLEPPDQTGEPGVVVVELENETEEQVRRAVEGLREVGADV